MGLGEQEDDFVFGRVSQFFEDCQGLSLMCVPLKLFLEKINLF